MLQIIRRICSYLRFGVHIISSHSIYAYVVFLTRTNIMNQKRFSEKRKVKETFKLIRVIQDSPMDLNIKRNITRKVHGENIPSRKEERKSTKVSRGVDKI